MHASLRSAIAILLPTLILAQPAASQSVALPGFEAVVIVEGLTEPVAFDFLDADRILILERDGRVVLMRDGAIEGTALRLPAATVGNRGGLGLATAPDFADSANVWLHYSVADKAGAWIEDRLARATFKGTRLVKPKVMLKIGRGSDDDSAQRGGALRFGPDGNLYALVGAVGRTGGAAGLEQNRESASAGVGGIVRLDADGEPPDDNPFAGAADAALRRWFAYGMREGGGLAFDPVTGDAWFGDPGADEADEVNHALAGANGGWALLAGPAARAGTSSDGLVILDGSTYVDPALTWSAPVGISALAFLDTGRYGPPRRDQLIAGDLAGNLHLLPLEGRAKLRITLALEGALRDGVADSPAEAAALLWGDGFGAIRDLRIGPDGWLYVLDEAGGRLLRVQRPVTATASYRVTFTAAWSAPTHPDPGFPSDPHFSGLIGGTHTAAVSFWAPGGFATEGIRNMAETGEKSPLDGEVAAAIAAGTAEFLLSGDPIPNSPGASALVFDISTDFPLVSLVSMVAPSPDWFGGVHDLPLFRAGDWVDEMVIELHPYDAGTDSGTTFTSPNAATVPREAIRRIVGAPFGPGDAPIGAFRFERLR